MALNFYLSLTAFLVYLAGGVYFLFWWITRKGQPKFLLFFALGMGMFLWFKIPNILANTHINFVQQNFYPFFFITLLFHLLAYFALIKGLAFFTQYSRGKYIARSFMVWFGLAILYFALTFFVPNFDVTYTPVWAGHLLFYIPAQLFIGHELWRISKQQANAPIVPKTGIALMASGIILLLASSVLYIFIQVWPYPRKFWYFSVISSPGISVLQILSGLCLFFGLYIFTKKYISSGQNLIPGE